MHSGRVRVDDIDKSGLQASTADKESVNVSLLCQLGAVLLRHTASIKDTGLLCGLGGDFLLQPLTDCRVNLLCLLGGSDLASANSPVA